MLQPFTTHFENGFNFNTPNHENNVFTRWKATPWIHKTQPAWEDGAKPFHQQTWVCLIILCPQSWPLHGERIM